jgi:N-acetylglucosaminyl-diphospho-decaprenol L-rhamnosyltransferase
VQQWRVGEISLVVVHFKTPLLLKHCLRRLRRYAPRAHLVVVDSGDVEETARLLEAFPKVKLIEVPNHSLAHAVNTGLGVCETDVIGHLNADVFVGEATFPRLLKALRGEGVGMVGPLPVTPEGTVQDQGPLYRLYTWRLQRLPVGASLGVPWLAGCLQVMRREVFQSVGGMDDSLRFYNEDIDLCARVRREGWACRLVNAPVLHLGGSATPQDPRFLIEGYRGGYILSRRYQSPLYRALHRRVVLLEAGWRLRHDENPRRREAYRQIARMFREGRFEVSPFGDSLEEANPAF